MAKFVYGIDLGTTYSCIAYVDEDGRANVLNNAEGDKTTPSVVNFSDNGQVVVGQTAKETAVIYPDSTAVLVKTLMGKTDFAINIAGQDKSPEEVSSYILRKLAQDAGRELGQEVKDVVITCPAYFGTAERMATRNAGEIAGLNVLEIISEPTAAALYYGVAKNPGEKTIMVYDLGGGTFDVTIMHIGENKIEVICSDGDHDLGGRLWDEALMRYLAQEFMAANPSMGELDAYDQQHLRLQAEKHKQHLTGKDSVKVPLELAGKRGIVELTRDKFEELTLTLLNRTLKLTDQALELAEKRGYKVDEVLLVGGSTRMPQVVRALTEKFGVEPRSLEPDEAVAKGAAIHAVNVYVHNQQSLEPVFEGAAAPTQVPGAENLNPDDYREQLAEGVATIGGKIDEVIVATTKSFALQVLINGEAKCQNLIIKNEPMVNGAVSVTDTFGTSVANQATAELKVYESDIMDKVFDIDEQYLLGDASLELPPGLPAGAPVEVTFTLNTEGILSVTGRDLTGNREVTATMRARGIMTADTVTALTRMTQNVDVV